MTTPAPSYSEATRAAAARVLAKQPGFVRRKDSWTAVAGTVLQLLNIFTLIETDVSIWVTFAVAILVGVAQTIMHAATEASITPSIIRKVSKEAEAEDEEYIGRHRLEG